MAISVFSGRRVAAVAALWAMMIGSHSADAASRQQVEGGKGPIPHKWLVDFGESSCSLVRGSPDGNGPKLQLELIAGSDRPIVMFADREWKDDLAQKIVDARVILTPSGARFEAEARPLWYARVGGRGLALGKLKEATGNSTKAFLDMFAKAQSVAVEIRGKTVLTFTFSGAENAVKVLRSCRDDLLKSWGIDVRDYAALTRPAKPIGERNWIRSTDYPGSAALKGISARAIIRYLIDVDGRVRECAVVASSGDAALDKSSCTLFTERGRYEPALGPDGKPVTMRVVVPIDWLWDPPRDPDIPIPLAPGSRIET